MRTMDSGSSRNADDDDSDDEEDDDEYKSLVQSVRSKTGLEVGIRVTWPFTSLQFLKAKQQHHHDDDDDDDNTDNVTTNNIIVLNLSTCLPPTEIAPMFHGTQWAGTRVWRAAIVTLQYLLCNNSTGSPLHEIISSKQQQQQHPIGIRILELGCGLGVPGMILQKCLGRYHNNYDCRVVLTDKSSLVQQLRQNITANFNFNNDDKDTAEQDNKIQAHELDWSDSKSIHNLIHQTTTTGQQSASNDDHEDYENTKASTTTTGEEEAKDASAATDAAGGFDLVFNCDCIYEHLYGKESWQSLLQCQEVLLQHKPNTICITAVERRNGDGVDAYLEACAASKYVARVECITLSLPTKVDDDIDDGININNNNNTHGYYSYWAKHPPPPEVEIYRAHGHAYK